MDSEITKNKIIETAKDVLQKTGFEGEIKIISAGFDNNSFPVLSIESENNLSMLIGRNGQNLNAFEHIVKIIVSKKIGDQDDSIKNNFIVDINDYRKSRAIQVLGIAKNVAQRVINTQQAEALLPMSPYERRLVHTELASYKDIQTESIGEEPRRRVVIKPQPIGSEDV